VKDIRRAARRHFRPKTRFGPYWRASRGDGTMAELCRKKGIAQACITANGRPITIPARSSRTIITAITVSGRSWTS
jgi:hypothetical protein